MPPLSHRRTPTRHAESGVLRAVHDGRAARGALRSLALLVDRMATLGAVGDGATDTPAAAAATAAVRDALRQFNARMREAPMSCRVVDGQFILGDEPVDRGLVRDDPLLGAMLFRCATLGVGGITVRQGAAPAELLSLANVLARPRSADAPSITNDTPTSMSTVADQQSRELLRSWSVLVTPVETPGGSRLPTPAAGVAAFVPIQDGADGADATPDTAQDTAKDTALLVARLASAHDDVSSMRVVDTLVALVDQAEFRGEARVLEQVAIAAVAQVHLVGSGGGRLAVERLLRRLQHRSSLELLAKRLPYVYDRAGMLELLSRAGETGVDILVKQLMDCEDAAARRVYFDSIVQLDMAGPALFDLLRDTRWFVVRNAIALLGEMGVEQADTAMLPLLQHTDERIRVAVARALVRIGTPKALQGLHAMIDDSSAEVRRIAAVSYGLSTGTTGMVRPPAARLSIALDKETDEHVALEMLASLGTLGSADAVQRLLRIAMPQGQMGEHDQPRDPLLRIAALEALVKARGGAVMPHVEALTHDPDPEVAQAAFRLRG